MANTKDTVIFLIRRFHELKECLESGQASSAKALMVEINNVVHDLSASCDFSVYPGLYICLFQLLEVVVPLYRLIVNRILIGEDDHVIILVDSAIDFLWQYLESIYSEESSGTFELKEWYGISLRLIAAGACCVMVLVALDLDTGLEIGGNLLLRI